MVKHLVWNAGSKKKESCEITSVYKMPRKNGGGYIYFATGEDSEGKNVSGIVGEKKARELADKLGKSISIRQPKRKSSKKSSKKRSSKRKSSKKRSSKKRSSKKSSKKRSSKRKSSKKSSKKRSSKKRSSKKRSSKKSSKKRSSKKSSKKSSKRY